MPVEVTMLKFRVHDAWGMQRYFKTVGETVNAGEPLYEVESLASYRSEITRRSMMTLSLTFDHRVIDGAPAAQFLQSVIELFNNGNR